mmetsp:Transcript_30627/g.30098  ORF Transcript_30627/g.30098 Transcript_30627/m.30098 type:complete len:123 (-) Transcript_30627:1408-1776(-)
MEFIKTNVIKRISDLPLMKLPFQWRIVGFEMFCGLAEAKGEEGFKAEPSILRNINNMCSDTNWKIRMKGAIFLYEYLQPVHDLKKGKKGKEGHEEESKVEAQKVQEVKGSRRQNHAPPNPMV